MNLRFGLALQLAGVVQLGRIVGVGVLALVVLTLVRLRAELAVGAVGTEVAAGAEAR